MVSISAASQFSTGSIVQRADRRHAGQNGESFDALLGRSTQQTAPSSAAGSEGKAYDFSDMTRQEIADAGKELFQQGKITLDELFRFDHPDGLLRVSAGGGFAALNSDDRIDFIAETRNAIQNMELTGEARLPKSGYDTMVGLLAKLTGVVDG